MEGYKGGLKGYWKRRPYERLDRTGSGRRRKTNRVELVGGRRRFWRIKITPRLRFWRIKITPRRILARIRDAYVRMMVGFANSGVFGGGFGYGGEGLGGYGRPQLKEYDEKRIVEIYKSLIAQGRLIAVPDGGPMAQIALGR